MNKVIVGILYVVATPIGNLGDLSQRAVEVLKNADLIVAEDTRHCKVLLEHYGIDTAVKALHEHNEKEQASVLVQRLLKGENLALVSDAGTPLISDPGYRIVSEAQESGVKVSPIPGACAAIAALSASGLPTDRFVFEGFLPVKSVARCKHLEKLRPEARTLIFYEAPHRILEVLQDMQAVFGDQRRVVLARELTKMFETILHGTLPELVAAVSADSNQQRGEMVLLLQGASEDESSGLGLSAGSVLDVLLKELPLNQAVKLAVEITGQKRNELYKAAIAKKPQEGQ